MASFLSTIAILIKEMLFFVSYIKNNTFPQPLSQNDEEKYLIQMAEGDQFARNKLIEHNLRLVAHIVKKFDNTGEHTEDLISIGTIGLIKGVESFKSGKGTKLATYAARCIENEILMYLRTLKKVQKDVSLFEPIGGESDGQSLEIADLLQTDEEPPIVFVEQNEQKERLYKHLGKLDGRELEIIQRRFGLLDDQPMTQKAIAEQLNISRSYVSRIEKRAIVKLYQLFKHEYKA